MTWHLKLWTAYLVLLKKHTFHEERPVQQNKVSRDHSILFPKSLALVLDDLKNLTPLKSFKVKWINVGSRKLSVQTAKNLHSSSRFHLTHAKSTFIIAVKKNLPKAIFNLDGFTDLRKLSFLGMCS